MNVAGKPVACVLSVSPEARPDLIFRTVAGQGGYACGRSSTEAPITLVLPSRHGLCTVTHGLPVTSQRPVPESEATAELRLCSPVAAGTRPGHVTLLVDRRPGRTVESYALLDASLSGYVQQAAVPARYSVSEQHPLETLYCFESASDADIPAYLNRAGFHGLDAVEVVRGYGTCADVARDRLDVGLNRRELD